MQTQTTLVATLGGKPHLISFLLDLLLKRGEKIDQVIVVYLAHYPRSKAAYECLKTEFSGNYYRGHSFEFWGHPIQAGRAELVDIRTPPEVDIVHQNIYSLFSELKEKGQRIHLGLSGGRRLISMVALTAAMQYLTPADRLWHIHAGPEFIDQANDPVILHAPPEADLRLVPVPFVPWVAYFPGLTALLNRSPREVHESVRGWLDAEERARCYRVWEKLTRRQKEVLRAFASDLSRQEVAQKLNIAESTVDSHRDSIVDRCKEIWEAQDGKEFDIKFLQQSFGPFLAGLGQTE